MHKRRWVTYFIGGTTAVLNVCMLKPLIADSGPTFSASTQSTFITAPPYTGLREKLFHVTHPFLGFIPFLCGIPVITLQISVTIPMNRLKRCRFVVILPSEACPNASRIVASSFPTTD